MPVFKRLEISFIREHQVLRGCDVQAQVIKRKKNNVSSMVKKNQKKETVKSQFNFSCGGAELDLMNLRKRNKPTL